MQLSVQLKSCAMLATMAVLTCLSNLTQAQTEVLTVQGNLPRLNYRDGGGNLLWAIPANSVLWKLDGPFHAGVIVSTAAAPSGSVTLNEGGVSIRGGGFPSAKLHVGTITSPSEPGEVKVDPGNPAAIATIHAINAGQSTFMQLETLSNSSCGVRMVTPNAKFSINAATNFSLRDDVNLVNPILIVPNVKNSNSIVIKNGNIGMGITNPTSPLVLASGAKCSAGGVWTNASSRELKDEIQTLSSQQAADALKELSPVIYRYKSEPDEQQVGFIAEDVPELVATKTRKELSPMDIVAVLTKVVQDQQTQLDKQTEQINKQAKMLEEQQELLKQIQAASVAP